MAFLKKGQTSEATYAYTETDNPNAAICSYDDMFKDSFDGINVATYNYNYYNLNEAQIMTQLDNEPVAINIAANDWQSYTGGILECTSSAINHAALLVGYGTDNGVDYWLIKNSWGTSWGENGYIRVSRDTSNYKNCRVGRSVFALSGPAMLFKGMLLLILAFFLY